VIFSFSMSMLSIYLLLSSPLLPLPIKLLHFNFMYAFMFWVPCHDLCYDFHVNTMFESSWLPFVLYVLFILLLFICAYWCSTPFWSLVFCVMLCRSLFVLFLLAIDWIVYISIFGFWLPLWYLQTFLRRMMDWLCSVTRRGKLSWTLPQFKDILIWLVLLTGVYPR
jgi:hypothetical protein